MTLLVIWLPSNATGNRAPPVANDIGAARAGRGFRSYGSPPHSAVSVGRACASPPSSAPPRPTDRGTWPPPPSWWRRQPGDGAELVVLPELFSLYGNTPTLRAGAEPMDGPTVQWAAEVAVRHRIWLVAGSFVEAAGRQPQLQHLGPRRARRHRRRPLPQAPPLRRGRPRGRDPGVRRRGPGRRRGGGDGDPRRRSPPAHRPDHLLRPPLPRALPPAVVWPAPW